MPARRRSTIPANSHSRNRRHSSRRVQRGKVGRKGGGRGGARKWLFSFYMPRRGEEQLLLSQRSPNSPVSLFPASKQIILKALIDHNCTFLTFLSLLKLCCERLYSFIFNFFFLFVVVVHSCSSLRVTLFVRAAASILMRNLPPLTPLVLILGINMS